MGQSNRVRPIPGSFPLDLGLTSPGCQNWKGYLKAIVATQDRVFPNYAPNSSIKHSKSDSKDCYQEIL
jgi:hypothetical protein